MAITGTNHGLSVLTNAAAEERLQWPFKDSAGAPAIFSLSTTFNDATSGAVYAHASGHEGIDFACGLNTRVCAMYAGVVIAVIDEYGPTTGAPYGNFVTIQSHTNPANNAGFEHTYAHLSTVAVACGDMVDKGDTIGQSGNTGRVPAHLHVHLKPFDRNGNVPCPWEDEPLQVSDHQDSAHSPIASRISGCMDFACFLPASHGGPPVTFDFLRSFNQLLSARDASARIPVYREMWSDGRRLPDTALQAVSNRLGTIDGSKLGGYVVTGLHPGGPSPDGYQIRCTEPERGWVFQSGTVGAHHVPWVQVEEAPGTAPGTTPS